jgi:CheY-like chemotaxis protein
VLVLDDEPDARKLIEHVLAECGADIVLAETAEEGLSLLAAREVDVIVSDIGLPGRDGYAFIADLRSQGIGAPAVALTAFAGPEDRRRALGAGYQTHIPKPVDPAELLAAVAALARTSGPTADGSRDSTVDEDRSRGLRKSL